MPPMLQEIVIGETKEQMREQIRKEMRNEIKAEEKARKDMLDMVSYLVPDIMKDIIFSMTHHNESRKNFYELWSNVPTATVEAAIRIAETNVNEMDDRYLHRSFSSRNMYMESESSSDGYDEYGYYEDDEDDE